MEIVVLKYLWQKAKIASELSKWRWKYSIVRSIVRPRGRRCLKGERKAFVWWKRWQRWMERPACQQCHPSTAERVIYNARELSSSPHFDAPRPRALLCDRTLPSRCQLVTAWRIVGFPSSRVEAAAFPSAPVERRMNNWRRVQLSAFGGNTQSHDRGRQGPWAPRTAVIAARELDRQRSAPVRVEKLCDIHSARPASFRLPFFSPMRFTTTAREKEDLKWAKRLIEWTAVRISAKREALRSGKFLRTSFWDGTWERTRLWSWVKCESIKYN